MAAKTSAHEKPPDLADLAREIAALRAEVAGLTAAVAPRSAARLMSMRKAAELIGVSRTRTLPALIRDGTVRTIMVNGRRRIASTEIERLQRAGLDGRPRSPSRTSKPTSGSARAPLARDLV